MAASKRLFALAVLIVVAAILFKVGESLVPYIERPVRDLRKDGDWHYLNTGLETIHGFSETGRWWTNTWCGAVPFWRPLTSYALWAMYLLWPPGHMLPRQIILVILHLCFTGLATVLLWRLTHRRWLVVTTLYLFAGYRPYEPIFQPQAYVLPVNDLLLDPKNITDTLVGLAILGSLLLLMKGKWVSALILAAASVGFKENGFTTWPLAVLMLGWLRRDALMAKGGVSYAVSCIRRNAVPIATWALVFLLLMGVHFITVGVGFRQGSNSFWIWRLAVFFGWPMLSNLFLFDRTAAFMALFVFLAILLARRSRFMVRSLALLAAVGMGIGADAVLQGTSWGVAATRILAQGQSLPIALMCFAWLVIVWLARFDWKYIVFGLAMALAAAAPSWMASQTWAHTRYVASVFMEMAIAAVIIQDIKTVAGLLARRRSGNARSRAG